MATLHHCKTETSPRSANKIKNPAELGTHNDHFTQNFTFRDILVKLFWSVHFNYFLNFLPQSLGGTILRFDKII